LTSTFAKASLNYSPGGVRCELNVLLQGY
jgi:hypothetical protein